MNERIKELAEQAKKYALDAMIKITDKEQALKVYSESYDTKFAELIVLECMHECLRMQLGNQYTPEEMLFQTKYRKIIKKHFGVEE